jgi:flagellar hook protein FlgE
MYAAISGLNVNQTALDSTANDLANVNTVGYKANEVTFADALTQVQRGAAGAVGNTGGTNPLQIGLGVSLNAVSPEITQGSLQTTGNPTDVAIQGTGWFRVGTGQPNPANPQANTPTVVQYTKAGNFTTNAQGFLTTQDGEYVMGLNAVQAGAPPNITFTPGGSQTYLLIPPGSTNIAIGQDGSVTYTDQNAASPTYGLTVNAGYLSLATFPNQEGMQRMGGSNWATTANSGAEQPPGGSTPGQNGLGATISGELEQSNVDMATEMTNMITAQRGYEANSKVITTADQMLQAVVNMVQ